MAKVIHNVQACSPSEAAFHHTRATPVSNCPELVDFILDVPPRYMWGWTEDTQQDTNGYCGETAFQSHGIFHGDWISSEYIRNAGDKVELLIGSTDRQTAGALSLNHEAFDNNRRPNLDHFLPYVRKTIDAGGIVVCGFYQKKPDGDDEYDHIMPIVGYRWNTAKKAIVGLHHNDLYTVTEPRLLRIPEDVTDRRGATIASEPDQPFEYTLPKSKLYAIALHGHEDEDDETYRMKLVMPRDREPDWGKTDRLHESPETFQVTAIITGLEKGSTYNIVRYDTLAVPSKEFLAGDFTMKFEFTAKDETVRLVNFDSIASNSIARYRCVDADEDS